MMVTQRASLPLLSADDSARRNWHFGRISATALDKGSGESPLGMPVDRRLTERLLKATEGLRSALGLRMFNLDAVQEVVGELLS